MACSLIEHKRITTTVAKAKALRQYVEPLITRSKEDSTHSRRVCFSYLKNKHAVTELFREVAPKVSDRNGGYTRIIRTGHRLGDAADMCMIELVDFNELYTKEEKKKTRRSRRGGAKKKVAEGAAVAAAAAEEAVEEATDAAENVAEEAAAEATEAAAEATEAVEEAAAEATEAAAEATEAVEEAAAEATDAAEEATDDAKEEDSKDDEEKKD